MTIIQPKYSKTSDDVGNFAMVSCSIFTKRWYNKNRLRLASKKYKLSLAC